MSVDSLEARNSDRIAVLIKYVEYFGVALLPEDVAALDDNYQRVIDI